MVGGTVVEVIDTGARVWVNCRDKRDHCAIYVERSDESRSISEGDSLWWQGQYAFWTPRSGNFRNNPPFSDKPLKRTSGSGVARP